jgi:hypothetical protein
MTEGQLTDLLAHHALGWRVGPDRYLLRDREWISKWRFKPLIRVEDAIRVLSSASSSYSIEWNGSVAAAAVTGNGNSAKVTSQSLAVAISVAVAAIVGISVPPDFAIAGAPYWRAHGKRG